MRGTSAVRIAIVAAAMLSVSISVAACSPPSIVGPAPNAITPSATPSPSPEPSPSPSVEAVPIPTDCTTLVSPETYASTFAKVPLNDPAITSPETSGVLIPSKAPPGSNDYTVFNHAIQLYCVWANINSESYSSFAVSIGTLTPEFTDRYLSSADFQSYRCEEKHGGRVCQYVYEAAGDPKSTSGHTIFGRDGVVIEVSQYNFHTYGVLGEMVTTIWG